MKQHRFPQRLRPAQRRADHHGARHGHLSAHLDPRLSATITACSRRAYFSFKGRKYRNHNKLLFGYKGTDGIKTGYTRASGFNLTASVHRGNKHLIAVVLGGKTGSQRDAAMRALLDKNFAAASETKPTPAQLWRRSMARPAAAARR